MDPYELLKQDHETVSKLFKRIESASGRIKLIRFRKLKHELDVHAHVEETIFYPALRNREESRDITLEAYEEHRVVKELLAELDDAEQPTDQWDAKLKVLKENVEHHVEEEEGTLFDKAREVLTPEQGEALGEQMAAEKERQGTVVPEKVSKPGLIKTVVNAIFGGRKTKTSTKRATEKPAAKQVARQRTTKKVKGKKKAAASTKTAKHKKAVARKRARKSAPKKTASRAKAA